MAYTSTGYADETAFHFEIEDGNITRKYYNYLDNHTQKSEKDMGYCEECPYGFLKKEYVESPLFKFLKDYGVEEDGTDV